MSAAIPAIRQSADRRFGSSGTLQGFGGGFRVGRNADLHRVEPDRLTDILELDWSEVVGREIEPPFDLPIGVLGRQIARRGNGFQSSGDVDAVAHEVPVGFLDDVAEMDANAENDATVVGHVNVALDEASLHRNGAGHSLDHTAKLGDEPIASALDDPPVMVGDGRINRIAAQRAEFL